MITLNRYPAMKRFALSLTAPVLGVLAFVVACTDATSPSPHAALRPQVPSPLVLGNVPPPPTRTAINVTVSSTGTAAPLAASLAVPCTFASGAFEGTYFSNGRNIEAAAAATEIGDPALSFEGTAWLRFDNNQPALYQTTASANARFQRTDQKLSGRGTLVFFNTCVVVIDQVTAFIANPACFVAGEPCAQIEFTGTINGQPARGTVEAFDREFCQFFQGEGFFCGSQGG